jgi:glutamate dehydrogenase
VCRAFVVAREVSRARDRWADVERLDGVVPPDVQARLMDGVDGMVEQLARWYLHNAPSLDIQAEIARGQEGFDELVAQLHTAATTAWRTAYESRLQGAVAHGVPEAVARFGASVPDLVFAPDILSVARDSGRSIGEVIHAFFAVGERLFLDVIEDRVAALPAESRWQRLAWTTMLDDLRLLRRQIASRVIAQAGDATIDEAVDAYLAARADPYARLANLMATDSEGAPDDSSLIMIMVHQIRQVVA